MLTQFFLTHPRSVDESYGEHALFAGRFGFRLLAASGAAFAHALLPCCFEKTASRMVADLYQQTRYRGAPQANGVALPGQVDPGI